MARSSDEIQLKHDQEGPIAEKDGEADLAKQLGKLNRHWYRRCLDVLGEDLQEAGSNPTVAELRDLCDRIITRFLEAVTSQAPDSQAPQFPADRAYFVPLESDLAGRFNFVKPYYQLLRAPQSISEEIPDIRDSLWSFLPWFNGKVYIDEIASVDSKGKTISFRDMISPRESGGLGSTALNTSSLEESPVGSSDKNEDLLLRKSLLSRSENLDLESISSSLRAGAFRGRLRQALAEVFEIYKTVPGNADIELILVNQVYVLRWLGALSNLDSESSHPERGKKDVLSMQQEDIKGFLRPLLHGYFMLPDRRLNEKHSRIVDLLQRWIIGEVTEQTGDTTVTGSEISKIIYGERERLHKSKFFEELLADRSAEDGSKGIDPDQLSLKMIETRLRELRPHFTSFYRYFLRPDQEKVLEQDLEALTDDDPRRAGDTESSFVWVCPDFQDLNASLPHGRRLTVPEEILDMLQRRLSSINEPYRQFFRQIELESLDDYYSSISNYWRTRGQASRSDRIFASYKEKEPGVSLPPKEFFGSEKSGYRKDPFPQNVFLRVRICDSLNEPVINGLFMFSTDYDEVEVWDKGRDLRREDTEDLLSFAKVFFFIVRDYIHGLDRAREAADIGRLNQYLFDRRLKRLERSLDRRLKSYDQIGSDLTESAKWNEVIYEILNSYAHALLDKPDDVRNETFPYDRLLILPVNDVGDVSDEGGEYALPFFLFQAIFVECGDEKIDGSHYSLVKPFQSPVERIDADLQSRFRNRSFQKEFETGEGREKLSEYLEKHYVSAQEGNTSSRPNSVSHDGDLRRTEVDGSSSFVVKASEDDAGRRWARKTLIQFWGKYRGLVDLWLPFLSQLTGDYQTLAQGEIAASKKRRNQLWFLFRLGLLRALLQEIDVSDPFFEKLRRIYHDRELQLRFGDQQSLDVLWLAGGPEKAAKSRESKDLPPDLFRILSEYDQNSSLLGDTAQELAFSEYFLRNQDPLCLEFFKFLTNRICNRHEVKSTDGKAKVQDPTWYQPLLTRPLRAAKETVTGAIDERIPRYEEIAKGEDALAMFIGVINLQIGRNEREMRRLRGVILMLRDYDDSKVGLYQSEKEIRERLASDLGDLRLFTGTFFQNAQRTLNAARERQQVRILSTDIQQIARNWYSNGMDVIVERLQEELRSLLRRPERPQMNRLRPETIKRLFETVVEVLAREERNRTANNRIIPLESFPCDRVLHVPLLFGSRSAACLSYARMIARTDGSEDTAEHFYEQIRHRGRHVVLGGGKKQLVGEPEHVLPGHDLVRRRLVGKGGENEEFCLVNIVGLLGDSSRLDLFIRRLYRGNTLQTLTLGGILTHLLELMKISTNAGTTAEHYHTGTGLRSDFRRIEERIYEVLYGSVRSLEQQIGEKSTLVLFTEVAMDRAVYLPTLVPLVCEIRKQAGIETEEHDQAVIRIFSEDENLPVLGDLLHALEAGREGWRYGLGTEIRSKLFYVYYSVPAPDGFLETFTFDPRYPRYRGVFCFVVDDATTDDKSVDSAAELADQEDIRTFVHNAMSSLRLVLDQQALENRLAQPGVDQFVSGMLHRLKNDLNEPAKAFEVIESALRVRGAEQAEQRELLQRIRTAQESLGGVKHLFQKLKGFGESSTALLRSFTSDTLGWMFVESLCSAALKEIGHQEEAKTSSRRVSKAMDGLRSLDQYAQRYRRASESVRTGGSVEISAATPLQRIERTLHRLERLLEGYLADDEKEKGRVEVLLSYDVFHTESLIFRGGYQLPEALNILIENAFQAAWGYVTEKLRQKDAAPPVARVAFICRRSEHQSGEILLEIENSSRGIQPEFLRYLNAPNPQPISAKRYHRSGGGKRGGSGFGHYFARRIITEFCGGRAARRRLDARIEDVATNLTRVRINLLEAQPPEPRRVSAEELLNAAGKVFEELRAEIGETGDDLPRNTLFSLPEDVETMALMQATRSLLEADRQLKENELLSLARHRLCRDLGRQTDKLREGIEELLEEQTRSMGGKEADAYGNEELEETAMTMRGELAAGAIRLGSFHDLKTWLESWYRDAPNTLSQLIGADKVLREALALFFDADGCLACMDILSEKQKRTLTKRFKPFEPFLRPESYERGLSSLLDGLQKDENGLPIPNREIISRLFLSERWQYRAHCENSSIRLEFRLSDTATENNGEADWYQIEIDVLKDFSEELMAYTFAQYQSSLAEANKSNGESNGGLAFIRQVMREDMKKAHHVASRMSSLELKLYQIGRDATPAGEGRS